MYEDLRLQNTLSLGEREWALSLSLSLSVIWCYSDPPPPPPQKKKKKKKKKKWLRSKLQKEEKNHWKASNNRTAPDYTKTYV